MNKPKISLVLYHYKTLADGSHPIMVRIAHNNKRKLVSTECSAMKEEWNYEEAQLFTKKSDGSRINKAIKINEKIGKKLYKIEEQCSEMGNSFQIDRIGQVKTKSDDLVLYAKSLIESMLLADRPANAVVYKTTLNSLLQFDRRVSFSKIDQRFLEQFCKHLNAKGLSQSSQNNYVRTLRAIFNRAISDGVIDEQQYPFTRRIGERGKFKVSDLNTKSRPSGLSIEQMNRFKEFDAPDKGGCAEAKRVFLLSYYLRGMSFTDLARLKWDDLESGRIAYVRKKLQNRKGASKLDVQIHEALKPILDYYSRFGNDYVLPVLNGKEKDEKHIRQKIQRKLKVVNAGLKLIAKDCDLPRDLRSYWARHTFAKTLSVSNVSIADIQEALGHSNLATTSVYLKSMNSERIDLIGNLL
jgi:integrase/recombinase XerD